MDPAARRTTKDESLATSSESPAAKLYARTVAIHESSARALRASGHVAAAKRVELLASVARERIGQQAAAVRMHALARRVRAAAGLDELLEEALDGAIDLLAADFGNLQLAAPTGTALRIVCQRGFGAEFLDHFAVVDDERSACGRAATAGSQAVIADVEVDPGFAVHRAIAAGAGFRAVQSTPLVDSAGRLHGVLSTHFERPHRPRPPELRMARTYARLVADAIDDRLQAAA